MKHAIDVYVGDFGVTRLTPKMLKAYGIEKLPINRRSSKQRRALARLEGNLKAVQEHKWLMGEDLDGRD